MLLSTKMLALDGLALALASHSYLSHLQALLQGKQSQCIWLEVKGDQRYMEGSLLSFATVKDMQKWPVAATRDLETTVVLGRR